MKKLKLKPWNLKTISCFMFLFHLLRNVADYGLEVQAPQKLWKPVQEEVIGIITGEYIRATRFHLNSKKSLYFFDFVNLDKTTGESIANAILAENNIDVVFARGQADDSASSAMSSEACGVQGRIRGIAPMALYTHCNRHVLSLNVAAACRLTSVRNMIAWNLKRPWLRKRVRPWKSRFAKFNETWWEHCPWWAITRSSFICLRSIFLLLF